MYKYQSHQALAKSLHDAKRRFYMLSQGKYQSPQAYLDQFTNMIKVVEYLGGTLGPDPALVKQIANGGSITQAHKKKALEETYAMAFLMGSDCTRYGRLIENTEHAFLQKEDRYPKTLQEAYALITNYHEDPRNHGAPAVSNEGVAFAQEGTAENETTGSSRRGRNNITCFGCGERGHYANECPARAGQSGTNLLLAGLERGEFDVGPSWTLANAGAAAKIPESWILLDNQSTVNIFANRSLLQNIRKAPATMDIHCNAGVTKTNWIGDLPGYGTVWYHKKGIANILSLSCVKKQHRVTFDSNNGNKFTIHHADGRETVFTESQQGLYYMDTAQESFAMLNTVAENKDKYTIDAYSRAQLARKIQIMIGRPSTKEFIKIVENNLLPNCPITRRDIQAAEDIFGPDVGTLKGKTVRRAPKAVHPHMVDFPDELKQYQAVTLCADIMFINKLPFLITCSRNIKFGTAELLENRERKSILLALTKVIRIYKARGLDVQFMLMDGEFEPLRDDLTTLKVTLNVTANDEHVGEIERYIRTVKERVRCIYNTLPFQQIPNRMVIEMVYFSVFWLNSFPARDGISSTLSPRTLVTGQKIDFNKHCRVEFGTYVQTHEQHDNSLTTRTIGAIALRPTGNMQGGHFFMSLATGRRISRRRWTALPMPDDVIERVHQIATQQNADHGLSFRDRNGLSFDDDDEADDDEDDTSYPDNSDDGQDDVTYYEDAYDDEQWINDDQLVDGHLDADDELIEEPNNNDDDVMEQNAGNNALLEEQLEDASIPGVLNNDVDEEYDGINPDEQQGDNQRDNKNESDDEQQPAAEPTNNDEGNDEQQVAEPMNDAEHNENIQQLDERYGARTTAYNLRPRRPRDYGHLHTTLESVMMTQHSLKKGLQLYGEEAVQAVLKELKQVHDRKVMTPKKLKSLTPSERRAALQYLMFVKKKRCGTIKGRGCADGRNRENTLQRKKLAPQQWQSSL
jgi:hypothetical protein